MKRLWKKMYAPMALFVCTLLSFEAPATVSAQELASTEQAPVQIYIGQQKATWAQEPYIDKGSTMVPMRALFEKLGFAVSWDSDTRTATGRKGDLSIALTIDKSTASVNQTQYYLDAAAVIKNESTYIPLRFVSAAAGADVQWDNDTRTVTIQTITDENQSIHHLLEQVTQSSSFLQRAVSITGASGITRNETNVTSVQLSNQNNAAKVVFQVGFTVSKATKTDHGVTISPAESVVYEFTGEVYKDNTGQWLLRTGIDTMAYVLKENKPFME